MKNKIATVLPVLAALLVVLCITGPAEAGPPARPHLQGGAPTVVSYQGRVIADGYPYDGDGYFKFAIVNEDGSTTYWSNDDTSTIGDEPKDSVRLTVTNGLFNVLLGDTELTGMTQSLTAEDFEQPDCYLRVWFSPDGNTYEWLDPDRRIAAVPYALQAQEAADADTVDGLHASELGPHYQNVVVVAKSGGDYASVQAAIDSITGAAADNPYLVWVAPGVYSETVTMKPYVHLQGAGQEVAVISSTVSSAWPPAQATLLLASDASLRDLTVGNTGVGSYNVALLATAGTTRTLVADVTARAHGAGTYNFAFYLSGSGTGITLQQVTALGENGSNYNRGLYNYNGAMATVLGGSFTARGGVAALGIVNEGGTLYAESVTALGEDGSDHNFGLDNVGGATALRGGSFTGREGSGAYGIRNYGSGVTLEAESVAALAEDGSNTNFGLSNYNGAVMLRGGSFTGRGGSGAYGIISYGSSATLKAESITALAENGSSASYGLYNSDYATANVTQSLLEGATNSVYRGAGGSVVVSNGRLVGGAVAGTVTCVAVSRDTTFNANGCP
jgi:hypothetical protein